MLPLIPADAKLSASEHLNPHISGRSDAYTLRFGIFDAEYLLFDVPIRDDERNQTVRALRDGTFGVVDDRGDVALAQRGFETTKNAAALARMGQ
jgi:hypothetical protein